MGYVFFLGTLFATAIASLARPWVGVVCAYMFVILTPQAIWFWVFQDLRPVYWVLLPTLVGFALAVLRRDQTLAAIANNRTFLMSVLWLFIVWSYFSGPFVEATGPYRWTDPAWALSTFNKIFLLYFLGCVLLDTEKKLKALFYTFAISAAYLIYWANSAYLSGRVMGRLAGPVDMFGVGLYSDENAFAMLFVVSQSLLWYLGHSFKSSVLRYGTWLLIPFGWHAVFLTASRGGLVGIAVTTLLMTLRSKKHKFLGLLLIPAFIVAYQWQAGDLMKSRADTIGDQEESSISARLESWEAASAMIAEHPLTGVGLASFGVAYPTYSQTRPHEAHNTFFQIAAESGLLAGLAYVLLCLSAIVALWRNGKKLSRDNPNGDSDLLYLMNEATLIAFFGVAVCGLFLSLQLFEIFYCLCVMVNAVLFISARRRTAERAAASQPPAVPTARSPQQSVPQFSRTR